MNVYNEIINICKELFLNFPEAQEVREYADKRISKSAQEKFEIGYFPSHKHINILSDHIDVDELFECEIFYERTIYEGGNEKKAIHCTLEEQNLVMPYKDCYGNIVALVGRSILDGNKLKENKIAKYKNTSFEKKHNLFGLYEGKKSIIENDYAFIVEGQMDCISAHDKGLENVVALGSGNITFDQFALLLRYTNNIYLLLDNDDAGNIGANKAISNFGKDANIVKMNVPTDYKDLDDYFKDNDKKDFYFWLKEKYGF